MSNGVRLLYISYWGVREPLGQSLMVPPLLRFAEAGVLVTLVSFEKPHHLVDRNGMEESRRQLEAAGIRWIPLCYHKTPTAPATAFDIVHGTVRSILASVRERPDVIHGRTFLGGLMGRQVSRVLRRPFIFHNEGFWPDEQIDGGHWPAGCRPYRLTKRWERNLYCRADAVITLSQPAREIVTQMRRNKSDATTIIVPSCVDLSRFRSLSSTTPGQKNAGYRLIYLGSLGGRYRIHEMARFVQAMRREDTAAMLTVYSHSDGEMIRTAMREQGVADDWWALDFVPHAQIPATMSTHDVGLFFLARGLSTRVCSPTKIGEYWACGLPVVTTPEVGDIDSIVRRERVGVIVESDTDEAYRKAAKELCVLLRDPELAHRCRAAAEQYYSLERSVETQLALYQRLAQNS